MARTHTLPGALATILRALDRMDNVSVQQFSFFVFLFRGNRRHLLRRASAGAPGCSMTDGLCLKSFLRGWMDVSIVQTYIRPTAHSCWQVSVVSTINQNGDGCQTLEVDVPP